MKNARSKTPAKTPRMVTQANGGQLLTGGNPGNVGGMGRPASVIRERCREAFGSRISFLQRLADGKIKQEIPTRDGIVKVQASPADRVRAMDMLGKYGALQVVTVDPPAGTLEAGEVLMSRILTMMTRVVASAPAAHRALVLQELTALEGTVEE